MTRGRNSATPANTVGRGRLLRTRPASCGVHLRRSITSGGAANTTAQGTMAGALPPRLNQCVDLAACWSIRQKPEHGRRMGWPRRMVLAGSGASMAAGSAKCGKAPTGTEQRRRRGSTTTALSRRCNCGGKGRRVRIRLDSMTSEAKRRTSRRWGSAKRTLRPLSFGTRLLPWHDTRRGYLL